MKRLGRWLGGGIFIVMSIFGLGIAGNAHDAGMKVFGFVMLAFGILMLFRLITFATGGEEEQT